MIKFFEKYPEILAIMSEKKNGSMKLFKSDVLNPENVENRKRFFYKIGIDNEKVTYAYLKSGVNVKVVEGSIVKIIPETDALITKQRNLFLAVTAADCIPVLFYDPVSQFIGIAHAGWRGIIGGIIKNTASKIIKLGGKAENMEVAMGPGINVCHYNIKEEFLDKFDDYKDFLISRDGLRHVDLKGIIKKQLLDMGIRPENMENNNDCTFEHTDKYFSYRRDKANQENMKAMMAIIGLR